MRMTVVSHVLSCAALAVASAIPVASQTASGATVTIGSGPDAGTYTIAGGARPCVVKPRPDGQPGASFVGSFDRSAGGRPASARGPMETSTAFAAGPAGTTDEFTMVVSFAVGDDLDMRAYEIETRRTSGRKLRGRGTARLVRDGGTVSAHVDAVTDDGVKVSLAMACGTVSGR